MYVTIKDITNNESDSDDDSCEKEMSRVGEDQVFEDTKEFTKILKEKGKHLSEQSSVLYPTCVKGLPNQVFVTTGNGDNVDPKINELLKEDNSKVTDEVFYSYQNVIENGLNQRSKAFESQKGQNHFPKKKKNTNGVWIVKTVKLNVEGKTKKN